MSTIRYPRERTTAKPLPGPRLRTREQGGLRSLTFNITGGPTGSTTYNVTVPNVAKSGTQKVTTDTVTPGFRARIARGERVNSPFLSVNFNYAPYQAAGYTRNRADGGAWETVTGPAVSHIFGDQSLAWYNDPVQSKHDNANRVATMEAWNRVEPAKSQSLVTVLEAHKSWATVLDRARKLASVVKACRTGNLKELQKLMPGTRRLRVSKPFTVWDHDGKPLLTRRGRTLTTKGVYSPSTSPGYLDEASQLWLEYRFGWTPMVYDIIDSMKAVYAADLRNDLIPRDILIARGREAIKYSVEHKLTKLIYGLTYGATRTSEIEYECRTYVHYRWTAPNGLLRRLNDFGLFDVPRAVWELVPFSFLADRIIPIGDYLGALTPKIGVEYLDEGHVMRTQVSMTTTLDSFTVPPNPSGNNYWPPMVPLGSADKATINIADRRTFLGIPLIPPIDTSIGIKQMADVAALFRSIR